MEQLKALLILKTNLEELKAKKILFPRFSFMDDKIILVKEAIAELEALQLPKTCETCKHRNECEINESSVHYLSWNFKRQCEDKEFGCIYHEPKDTL